MRPMTREGRADDAVGEGLVLRDEHRRATDARRGDRRERALHALALVGAEGHGGDAEGDGGARAPRGRRAARGPSRPPP